MSYQVRYVKHDQIREDEKAADKADRRAANREDAILPDAGDERFGHNDPNDEEFSSVEDFALFLMEEERSSYHHTELQCLWFRTGRRLQQLQAELLEYGLKLEPRYREQKIRMLGDNPNNLYQGNPMSGGGGGGSIYGMVD